MTFNINVQGGTRAGWRRVNEARSRWICVCGRDNPGGHSRCGDCGTHREKYAS